MWTAQAHEVAHQWFGDIVTMAWWDDLWLNEGFASWMETKAKDHFHPEWFGLLTRVNGRETAMNLDSFTTTHPVIQPIRTVEEANTAFDAIAYSKGEAVISMLEAYAGEDTWRDGIRAYIRDHQYRNTTSNDLWRAVEAAGAAGLVDIAHDFTLQPGVPLVRAESRCAAGNTVLNLTQGEFSRDRKDQVAARPQLWRVPLIIEAGSGEPVRRVLEGSATVNLPGCGPVVVNGGQLGYFRTLYSPEMAAQLVRDMASLEPIDQLGLLRDNFALAEADYQPLAPALAMLLAVPTDANPVVAQGAIARWTALYSVAGDNDRARVAALAREQWLPRLQQLGFEPKPSDTLTEADLRSDLITNLGNMGDATVVAEARRRFTALASDPRAMDGPLKTTWLGIIARNATLAEWESLLELARTAPTAVERQAYYALLGATTDPALARRAFDYALTGEAGTSSATIMTTVAAGNADFAYDYALANRDRVTPLIDTFGQASFISGLAAQSRDPAVIGKLEALRDSVPQDQRRAVERRIAALRQRLASEPRMREQLGDLLAARSGERG
jgi:aminopeptidase N